MDRNQAISVAVGVGAVGTALAYLGYSYYQKESDTANIVETKNVTKESWLSNLFVNSNTESESVNETKDSQNDEKLETKSDEPETKSDEPETNLTKISAWGQFWKGEFNNKDDSSTKED